MCTDEPSVVVEVDYGIGIAGAIEANGFEDKLDEQFIDAECQIPLVGSGKVTRRVAARYYNRGLTTQQVWNDITAGDFADPMTALAVASKYRDKQSKDLIVILWKDQTDKFCCLVLGGKVGVRWVRVSRNRADCKWPRKARFLRIVWSVESVPLNG
jgi:hypothetical protein